MLPWIVGNKAVPILCVAVIAGSAAYSLIAPAPETPELDASVGRRAVIEGLVVRDPDVREKTVRLAVRPENVSGTMIYHSAAHVLVSADRFTDVRYGDRIRANGILKKPEPFETDSGRTFNYPMYLRAHGVSHEMAFANVVVLDHGEGNPVVAVLLSVARVFNAGIRKAFSEPESALLSGLLLGEKQSLGDEITNSFRRSGVVHIIVLSGYNVALVSNFIAFFANALFPCIPAIGASGLGIIAFAIMTGASETTIRASAMGILVLIARLLRRPQLALRLLLVTAAGMALLNPFIVLFDLSYQLSVLATAGLILFSDLIAKRIPFIPEVLGLREIVSTTLATQATVLPLLILSVGAVSLVFLPTNVLILPAVPFAMLFGFVASTLALFSYTLALPFIAVAFALLSFIIAVAEFFGGLQFALVPIPADLMWPILGFLVLCYALAFFFMRRTAFPQHSHSGF